LVAAGINILEPTPVSNLEDWWSAARELVATKDRRGFDTLVLLIAWFLWKQKNARAFNNQALQLTAHQLVVRIKDEFKLWRLARLGGSELMSRE
jgi:nuclear pore complex protein Nup210